MRQRRDEPRSGRARARARAALGVTAIVSGLAVTLPGGATASPALQPECIATDRTVTCTYQPDSLKTFTVPDEVSTIDITAIGGRGQGAAARLAAEVTGRVTVASGDQLSIRVPATSAGQDGVWPDAPAGKGNGGGGSANVLSPTFGKTYAVAAGSGGAGTTDNAGSDGGNSDGAGGVPNGQPAGLRQSIPGGGGTGGAGVGPANIGIGGKGGAGRNPGAGGGGGFRGGGGGAGSDTEPGAAGGMGSSYVPSGGTVRESALPPVVVITYAPGD